jgi:hypothetical protein
MDHLRLSEGVAMRGGRHHQGINIMTTGDHHHHLRGKEISIVEMGIAMEINIITTIIRDRNNKDHHHRHLTTITTARVKATIHHQHHHQLLDNNTTTNDLDHPIKIATNKNHSIHTPNNLQLHPLHPP